MNTKSAERGSYARKYCDPDESRVVSVRMPPSTLKALRMVAAERDMTVSSLLRLEVERIAAAWNQAQRVI
ncbi:MAG: hypothetical protein JO067_11060 [Cupriavidus sp.]|nr:hypothetical protein [Cupriavidus sp.]